LMAMEVMGYDARKDLTQWKPSTNLEHAWWVWGKVLKKTHRKVEWMWRFFEDGEVRIEAFVGDVAHVELESGCGDWSVDGSVPLAICLAAHWAIGSRAY
jgi:hypothetical protein